MLRYSKEEIVQNIKDCGQSIIDNAEKIANSYKYSYELVIICHPDDYNEGPHILVETTFAPEKFVERF